MLRSKLVTLFLISLDNVRFYVHLVITGFKQVSAETREMIVYLYNNGKSQKCIAKETGISLKGVQGVLKS